MEDHDLKVFYNQWPYPILNISSIRDLAFAGYRDQSDPQSNWNKFFPNKKSNQPIKILVAGCGTIQAGLIGVRNPMHEIIGIDISQTSINIQEKLCLKDNINNVSLFNSSILDYYSNNKFDLIICSGVLHHVKNPKENLKKLSTLLHDDGIMSIMLYNEALRSGIYKIKKLIEYLDLYPNELTAKKLLKLIEQLDQNHSVKRYTKENTEINFLNNFMDTFFNPNEIAFNPVSVKELLTGTDLKFYDWLLDNYILDKLKDNPFYNEIKNLNLYQQAHIIDLIEEKSSKIEFLVKKIL